MLFLHLTLWVVFRVFIASPLVELPPRTKRSTGMLGG
jgi:hypothetical protein